MNKKLLLETFFGNNALNVLVEAVGAAFGCPVLVTDNAFHIVSASAAGGYADPEYRRALAHSELPLSVCTAVAAGEETGVLPAADSSRSLLYARLQSGGVAMGYILYLPSKNRLPAANDRLFAEELIAKQFFAERRAGSGVADTAQEILTELLSGKFANETIFDLKVAGTYLAHFHPERFVLLSFADTPTGDTLSRLCSHLEHTLPASHPFYYERGLIAFLHADHDLSLLGGLLSQYPLQAVVSPPLVRLFFLRQAYRDAADTLAYLSEKKDGAFLAYSENYALLTQLRRVDAPLFRMEPAVRRLYDHDAANKGALCLTLYTYLICRHSLAATGERLFTHRNTVQYRIEKIRDAFGIDPADPDRCLALLFSLSLALLLQGHDVLFIKE